MNDLPGRPIVGRVWDPLDEIPEPDDCALFSFFDVSSLKEAWEVIVFLITSEERILSERTAHN